MVYTANMIVYRITKHKFAADITGRGAALFPGRWNKFGRPVLYAGLGREIALLETIVHATPLIVSDLDILTIEIPDDSITELEIPDLPANWAEYPAPSKLSDLGEKWILEGLTIALKVPSSIINTSYNVILNCNHLDFSRVKVLDHSKFHLDMRLIGR
ncbi:MAG: RES family NAD+ phosphorylase [Saprospiraceae bacterium]